MWGQKPGQLNIQSTFRGTFFYVSGNYYNTSKSVENFCVKVTKRFKCNLGIQLLL